MIEKLEFIRLVEYYQEINKVCDSLYDHGIDIINSSLFENFCGLLTITLKLGFNDLGIEYINAYFEDWELVFEVEEDGKTNSKAYKTTEELWELVKEYRI